MRRVQALLTGAAVALFLAGVSAQGKPNFAGHWTLVPDANAPAGGGAAASGGGGGGGGQRGGGRGGGGGFCGADCTITQDASTITITRSVGGNDVKSVYKLEGAGSNSMNAGGNSVEIPYKTSWSGDKLTIVTTTNFNGNSTETTTAVSMDGANMKVETTRPGRNGGEPMTTAQSYKKG
jgi:hypothetical protein